VVRPSLFLGITTLQCRDGQQCAGHLDLPNNCGTALRKCMIIFEDDASSSWVADQTKEEVPSHGISSVSVSLSRPHGLRE
jgi:hypothetical protein